MPRGPRTGHKYRQLRRRVLDEETHCTICGKWVDQALEFPHPMSPTLEHLDPIAEGGSNLDRERCRLAHLRCNSSRGGTLGAARARAKRARPSRSSIDW